MSEITNPHDRFVREMLQETTEAISFLDYKLSPKVKNVLDLSKLELSSSNFISEKLKEEQTDLLFKIPLKSGGFTNVYLRRVWLWGNTFPISNWIYWIFLKLIWTSWKA